MYFWPFKCVGVKDLKVSDIPTIWGTSEKDSELHCSLRTWSLRPLMRLYVTEVMKNLRHSQDICIWGEGDGQSSSVLAEFDPWCRHLGDVMWSLIDGKHIVSVPHHDGLFVDRGDDCLDEKIDGRTDNVFDAREDNSVKENEGAEVDIILSRPKCGFWFPPIPRNLGWKWGYQLGLVCPGCFVIWIHQMIPLDMMMATLDLMLDIYIRC